jgi:phosphatidylglycerol---prolipoprotein diacylglyceryl transferase
MVAERACMSSVIPWFQVPTIAVARIAVGVPEILAVAGAVFALAMCRHLANRAGLSPRRAVDGLALVMLSALLFSRLAEGIYYPEQVMADWRILLPWRGGFTSIGLLVGAAIALAFLRRSCAREHRWAYLDAMVPASLVGGCVVRVGCFLGHHHAGRLWTLPGTVAYPGGARLDLGLCEALLLFVVSVALLLSERCIRARPGWTAMVGATAYAVGRFALECVRADDLESIGRRSDPRYLGLTLVQYAVLGFAAIAVAWFRRAVTAVARSGRPSVVSTARPVATRAPRPRSTATASEESAT